MVSISKCKDQCGDEETRITQPADLRISEEVLTSGSRSGD
jgi:hypothetical protein